MFGSSSTISIFVVPMTSPLRRPASLRPPSGRRFPAAQRGIEGQRDDEFAALFRSALDLHLAAVRPGDMPHQRKPQARALDVVHQGIPATVELLEDLFLLVLRDSDAVVGHL